MEKKRNVGVFQCENGNWGYRYTVVVGGETRAKKKVKDENGIPFKSIRNTAKLAEVGKPIQLSESRTAFGATT